MTFFWKSIAKVSRYILQVSVSRYIFAQEYRYRYRDTFLSRSIGIGIAIHFLFRVSVSVSRYICYSEYRYRYRDTFFIPSIGIGIAIHFFAKYRYRYRDTFFLYRLAALIMIIKPGISRTKSQLFMWKKGSSKKIYSGF